MNTFDFSKDFTQLGKALHDLERTYLTGGAKAMDDVQRHLKQFSKAHPLPNLRDVAQQFPQGRLVIAVNDALDLSNRLVVDRLTSTVQGLDFRVVKHVLLEVAVDTAKYLGGGAVLGGIAGGALGSLAGGVGAVPGMVVGAEVGFEIGAAIMALVGLKDLAKAFWPVVSMLFSPIIEGFSLAVRAGLLPENQHVKRRELIQASATAFAQGKFILIVGLLAAVAAVYAGKLTSKVLEKIGSSKLGTGFAAWLQKNEQIVMNHPALKIKSRAGAEAPPKAPSAEKPAPAAQEPAKPKQNEAANEGQADIPCVTCVRKAAPVNPISGAKFLADAIDLDFALPAALPMVWQRTYSSAQRQAGWLGSGWDTPLSIALEVNVDSVVVLAPFARKITFSLPAIGESLYSPSEKITLIRTHDRSFELVDDKGERDLFALSGTSGNIARLVGLMDANGNRITITYNQRQLPERVEDSAGRGYLLAFEDHRGFPRLRSIAMQPAEPESESDTELLVAYEYDASGNLAKVSNGKGNVMRQFAYRNHLMVEHSQPGGLVSRYEYDEYAAGGKVTRNWLNDGRSWDFRYLDQETIVIDNLGREERFRFDAKQRLVSMVDAAGGVSMRRYDSNGNLLAITDPGGRSVTYRYDQRSRVTRIDSGGNGTGIVYDNRFDKPALITDALGATTALRYDELGNLASVTDALGHRTSYQYDANGLPVKVTDAAGGIKKLAYNRAAQLISYTDCSGNTSYFSYDSNGKLLRVTDAQGNATVYSYDEAGRLIKVAQPDGTAERYDYDTLGRLLAQIDPVGNRTSYVLDSDGQPLKRIDARGGVLEYRYDAARRMAELINENGDAHRFEYDSLDRLSEESGFDARVTRYRYDESGLLVAKEELGSGERTEYTRIDTSYKRDSAGQLVDKIISRVTGPARAEQLRLRFAYDNVGRMTQAINADAVVSLEYDALGQLVGERTESGGATTLLRHAYDELGNRIQTVLPDGRVLNNLFYGSGHLHQINIDGEVVTDIERDQLHRPISRTQGALSSQFRYDPMGRMLSQVAGQIAVGEGAVPVIARTYEYDENGNLLAIDDKLNGLTKYSYDVIGRILSATQPQSDERFAFDPAHNLLDESIAGVGRVEGNRVRVFEDKRYDYDVHGNLTQKLVGGHTQMRFAWNGAHQLVKSVVTRNAQSDQPTVQTVRYVYDPFGRRIAKRDAFGTTAFVWDGNRVLREARSKQSRVYIYEPYSFVPVAQIDNTAETDNEQKNVAQVHYLHTDHLGSPREVTTGSGRIKWAATFRVWGNTLRLTEPDAAIADCQLNEAAMGLDQLQPIRFQGQYHDSETGLHYNRFRYYDPDIGRFISQDPIGLLGGNNIYQYAPNPVSWVDPLGLAKCPCALADKIQEEARAGKVRRNKDSHGRLGDELEADILSSAEAVYQSKNGNLVFHKGENIVVTEGSGSIKGHVITSYGTGGPQGTSGAAIYGGLPSAPGQAVTAEMITLGKIPKPNGTFVPPAKKIK